MKSGTLADTLTPVQVVTLQDALLANADRLLKSARAVLALDNAALAQSLAILGLEESAKAIALHCRRVAMAYAAEGEPFVDASLKKLWTSHREKLQLVHQFLVDEPYWFGEHPPDRELTQNYLGTIDRWANQYNLFKQRGFYVDVDAAGNVLAPSEQAVDASLADVIDHVHQIGWQLRLGEHIEAKRQAEAECGHPPAPEKEVERMRDILSSVDDEFVERLVASMREGQEGQRLNNDAYRLHLPAPGSDPFQDAGRPGYEAQDRELRRLSAKIHQDSDSSSE
jgi:AbiV family abortive infection protein